MVKPYAPNPYPHGSSIAHVDQDTDADFKTGLMAPKDFGAGTDKNDILTLGIMADIGDQLVPGAVTARAPPPVATPVAYGRGSASSITRRDTSS